MSNDLLTRVANVCNYYRGAVWHLHYSSEEGGQWALTIQAPSVPGEDDITMLTPILGFLMRRQNEPIFAMRCHNLEVVASSLEHWHATTLSTELPG